MPRPTLPLLLLLLIEDELLDAVILVSMKLRCFVDWRR
jgi:hypothetical protein